MQGMGRETKWTKLTTLFQNVIDCQKLKCTAGLATTNINAD